jgi:hypothetical protein
MIRRVLYLFLTLMLGYQSLLWLVPSFGSFQHQWQENEVIAERYLFGPRQDMVILGTSLATRLDMQQLPGMYKMTFGGLGIFDGLSLLLAKDSLPSQVYIETNFLLRKPNQALMTALQNPITYGLKRRFSMFRADKQPVGMAIEGVKIIRRWVNGEQFIKSQIPVVMDEMSTADVERVDTPLMRGDFFVRMMQAEAYKFSQPTDSIELDSQIALLQTYIEALINGGVAVYLFEMPIEQELQNLPVPMAIRRAVRQHFATHPKITILPRFTDTYFTEDGLHLGWREAQRFTRAFRQSIKKAP